MLRELIRKGASAIERMMYQATDEEKQLEYIIHDWINSRYRKEQKLGERYYLGKHDILEYKRMVIGKGGELEEVKNLPNNRIVDNQYGIHTEKKANYMFGRPISIESKNETYAKEVRKLINHKFMATMKEVCLDAMNQKIGWLYVYYSDSGLKFKKFTPYEILPIWTDSCHDELEKVVRLYEKVVYSGSGSKEVQYKVEVYTKDGIKKYDYINDRLYPSGTEAYFNVTTVVDGEVCDEKPFNWQRIPIIPFKYNPKEVNLIMRVKSLQDGINRMLSTFQNNMEEDSRNTILVLVNYDGENLSEFRNNLQKYGAVKVRSENGGNGDLKTLQVEVKAENYKAIVDIFKKALIQNMRSSDTTELRSQSGGSPNQMNIQSIYSDMDNDANSMETQFQASFDDLMWFVNTYLSNAGKGDFDDEISFVLNRDMMQDEALIVQSMTMLNGIISKRTLVSQLPFINDPDKEMKQIEEEQKKEMEAYSEPFSNNPNVNKPEKEPIEP